MQLRKRQRKILDILLKNRESFISSQRISDLVGVSDKTVQSDIEILNEELSLFNVEITSSRGKGYILEFGGDEIKLLNILSDLTVKAVEDIDVSLFICQAIITPLYTTQQEMLDLILCSVGGLKDILAKSVIELSRHNQTIKSVPGSGFIVVGDELSRRMAFIYHFDVVKEDAYAYERFMNILNSIDFQKNDQIIEDYVAIIKDKGYFVNDKGISLLKNYLNYTLYRLNDNRAILSMRHEIVEYLDFVILDKETLVKSFGYNIIEHRYFNIVLLFIINESSFRTNKIDISYSKLEQKALEIIDVYFNRRPSLFSDTFFDLDNLQNEISSAIILIIRRNIYGFRESHRGMNYIGNSDENIVAIEFASLLAFKLENDLKVEFYQEDIIRLSMIFNIYFYNNLWTKYKNIVLYSDQSTTKSRYLKRELQKEIPNMVIHTVSSIDIASLYFNEESTLVVYEDKKDTYNFENELVVKSFSMVEELSQVLKYEVSHEKNKEESFFNLFDISRFHPNVKFKRRNDAVAWVCKRYGISGERRDTIQLNVYTRELRYISTVYSRAAYPKIYIDNIEEPIFEVITLDETILWGNREIDVIFIALLPNSYSSLDVLGRPFNQLRMNANLISKISKTTEYEDFINLLAEAIK